MAMAATRSAEATAKLEVVIVVVGSPAVAIPTAGWLVSGGSSVMSGVSHRLPVYDPALIRDVDRFKHEKWKRLELRKRICKDLCIQF